jgi:adenylylsulfate kinase-like enzyme
MILWFTGMSGSGKTALAGYLKRKYGFLIIDGDELRRTINSDLGYKEADKKENGRRMIELCKWLSRDYNIVVSTITGKNYGRRWVLDELRGYGIKMIWIECDIETCIKRDPKGLYKKDLQNFIGVNSNWENPKYYDLCVNTDKLSFEQSCKVFDSWLIRKLKRK